MTSTSCAKLATMPRSCVISMTARSRSSESRSRRSITLACVVTSSAVVGSSAISRSGFDASAIAIITRCRIPPENSCGYWRSRVAGEWTPTSASSEIARSRASVPETWLCWRIASTSWNSIDFTGFSEPSASWKIIEILPPRTCRSTSSVAPASSRSPRRIEPPLMRPGGSSSPSTASASVDFPEPDSPTTATRWPRRISSAARSTARTTAPWIGYSTLTSSIERTVACCRPAAKGASASSSSRSVIRRPPRRRAGRRPPPGRRSLSPSARRAGSRGRCRR